MNAILVGDKPATQPIVTKQRSHHHQLDNPIHGGILFNHCCSFIFLEAEKTMETCRLDFILSTLLNTQTKLRPTAYAEYTFRF